MQAAIQPSAHREVQSPIQMPRHADPCQSAPSQTCRLAELTLNSSDFSTHPTIRRNAPLPFTCNPQHDRLSIAGAEMVMPRSISAPTPESSNLTLRFRLPRRLVETPAGSSAWQLRVPRLRRPIAVAKAPKPACGAGCPLAASKSPGPRLGSLLEACGPFSVGRRVPGSLWPGCDGRSVLRSRPSARAVLEGAGVCAFQKDRTTIGVAAHALTIAAP